jgi:hypothetical protein
MAPPQDRYTLRPITVPDDYPTLVALSIESFKLNPFHYLVYPETANVSREEIEAYVRIATLPFIVLTNFTPSMPSHSTTKNRPPPYPFLTQNPSILR